MAWLFGFPASDALQADYEQLTAAYAGGQLPSTPMAPVFIDFAQRYADEILDALILNLVRGADPDSAAPKTLESAVSLIKSTAHALIRQALAKRSNRELASVAEFMRTRRVRLPHQGELRDFISFPISTADHALLAGAWGAAAEGQRDIPAMTQATLRLIDLGMQAFYQDTGDAIELGFVARKMFNMGHVAIQKALNLAAGRLVPALKPRELRDFSAYFLSMLQAAPTD